MTELPNPNRRKIRPLSFCMLSPFLPRAHGILPPVHTCSFVFLQIGFLGQVLSFQIKEPLRKQKTLRTAIVARVIINTTALGGGTVSSGIVPRNFGRLLSAGCRTCSCWQLVVFQSYRRADRFRPMSGGRLVRTALCRPQYCCRVNEAHPSSSTFVRLSEHLSALRLALGCARLMPGR